MVDDGPCLRPMQQRADSRAVGQDPLDMAVDTNFHEFDLTLTDQDLEDFLTVIERQNGTELASCPAVPNGAIASIGGLQAQPHSNSTASPSCSEDTGSGMLNGSAPAGPLQGSLDSIHAYAMKSEGSPLDASAIITCSDPAAFPSSCALPTSYAPPGVPLILPALNPQGGLNLASSWPPQLVQSPGFSAATMSPAMQQLFIVSQQQQQQYALMQQQNGQQQQQQQQGGKQGSAPPFTGGPQTAMLVNAMGGLRTATSMNGAASAQAAAAAAAAAGALQHAGSGFDPDKLNTSHSTVEKQRRDRLNSLIEELGDMVPPSDPKYNNEGPNIRRPKHVVLSDTISLLRSLQDKVKFEEAQIVQLRQQAADATAAAEGAAAAAAAAAVSRSHDQAYSMIRTKPDGAPELPLAPDNGMNATGVVVEQGPNCLYVKINCKDRKGLLSDLVGALKSFPLVISTAAITTTQEGKVYDVFEVRLDDDSITAEDVQCAVHTALYDMGKVKGKRLRGNTS